MGGPVQSKKDELAALHTALVAACRTTKTLGKTIPLPVMEAIMVQCFGVRTRQSCQDTLWSMERLRLIHRVKGKGEGKGVIVLDSAKPAALSMRRPQTPPHATSA